MADDLPSWRNTPTRQAIIDFVTTVTHTGGPGYIPPADRIATFDNDGTLWCEKPMPIELVFILQRLAAMAADDASLRRKQPWQAAYTKDYQWLGDVVTEHYSGDDTNAKVVMAAIVQAFAGTTVDEYEEQARQFVLQGRHPTLNRSFATCAYGPMIELLQYLESNGFTTYIASGGDRDFMRPSAERIYGIPPERVIGSSNALRFQSDDAGATLVYDAEPDVFDDGPTKPVRIWSRVGRRPVLVCGNSNGDVPMLQFAGGSDRPTLRMLIGHDDADREFAYTAGAEQALETADEQGWTVVSMADDWTSVFSTDERTHTSP